MGFYNKIHKFQENIFFLILIISWTLYFCIWVGLFASAPKYLSYLDFYVKIYVSLFLILRFNPFRKVEFTALDREIAFSSGVFLFSTTYINELLQKYAKYVMEQGHSFIK